MAIRSAIARAVSSGFGLENSVDRKLVPVFWTVVPISRNWLTESTVKSKLAPRHKIGCCTSVSAALEETMNNAFTLSSERLRTKKGTILFPFLVVVFVVMIACRQRICHLPELMHKLSDVYKSKQEEPDHKTAMVVSMAYIKESQ